MQTANAYEQSEESGGDAEGHPREGRSARARQKAEQVSAKLKEMKLADAAVLVTGGIEQTPYYSAFPRKHWRYARTINPLDEVRSRT
jgi:hypothetical protein